LNETKYEYSIISIVITHNPPESIKQLLSQLSYLYKIIIIDSSTPSNFNTILTYVKNCNNVIIIHEEYDYGLGNALNIAIKTSQKYEYDFLLIMEDDTILIDNIDIYDIINKFLKIYNNNDVLYLSDSFNKGNEDFIQSKNYLGTNSGFILSKNLIKKISFRSEFFIDQIDVNFQFDVKKMGGRIFFTKYKYINRLPVGRETKNNINTISIYRFYLLTRNTIVLFLEKKIGLLNLLYIPGYFFKSLIIGMKISLVLKAFLNGIIDGVTNNLGITKTLKYFRPDLNYPDGISQKSK
jgi:rhamnosyltransferase